MMPGRHAAPTWCYDRYIDYPALEAEGSEQVPTIGSSRCDHFHDRSQTLNPFTMTSTSLRTMIEDKPFLTCPGIFDLVSAKLADRTGPDALYMTGYGDMTGYGVVRGFLPRAPRRRSGD